jgi:hypothetical protein
LGDLRFGDKRGKLIANFIPPAILMLVQIFSCS